VTGQRRSIVALDPIAIGFFCYFFLSTKKSNWSVRYLQPSC
jgi:hypothetical protein